MCAGVAETQPRVQITVGEGWGTDSQGKGAAWGPAAGMCFLEKALALGLGRGWIGAVGSGRALRGRELLGKRCWKREAGLVQSGQS